MKVYLPFILLICIVNYSCQEEQQAVESTYKYIEPQYDIVRLSPTTDTIAFILQEDTYNVIKSQNIFSHDGLEYISFFDERSSKISIYNVGSKALEKILNVKRILRRKKLYKTTVYCKNFDSIFITNNQSLYLADSSGQVRSKIGFLTDPPNSMAHFENTIPAVFSNNLVYAGVRPYVNTSSLKALRNWKLLYSFDFKNKKATLQYSLPRMYKENLYGYHYLDYGFCYNNRSNFVFSFPADTNIYETNLSDYHLAYFGKSQFQTGDILPISKEDIKEDEGYKQYKLRDSYGAIIFDPYRKTYLRLAKRKQESNTSQRNNSIIVFNESLQIIGESPVNNEFSFSSIFFTTDGEVYAGVNTRNEYALQFVRLVYDWKNGKNIQLSSK